MEQKLKHGNYNIQLQNDEYLPDLPNLPPLLNLPNAFFGFGEFWQVLVKPLGRFGESQGEMKERFFGEYECSQKLENPESTCICQICVLVAIC
jgi:hypothetical protein